MQYKEVYPMEIKQGFSSEDSYLLILAEPGENKSVPIVIGESEAQAIILASQQAEAKRPTTHRMMCNLMQAYDLTLKKVTIDRFEEGIYYATLHVTDGFSDKHIDSRTSDAVTLALLKACPIEMNVKVIEETGIEDGSLEQEFAADNKELTLEELREMLAQAEENEDYELAANLHAQIELIENQKK